MKVRRPILRYHGGKWNLGPWIMQYFPPHRTYTEPFGGAASLLLRKPRSYAEVYNDLDGEVCNLFKVVRDSGQELIEALRLTPFARTEFSLSYEPCENSLERARRTVIRSLMGIGSNGVGKKTGFRDDSFRANTIPSHDWINYPENLYAIIERLQGVIIENRDALRIIRKHDGPDTLHYIDPPYLHSARNRGRDYKFEYRDEDHHNLLALLKDCRGMVVLSAYSSELYSQDLSDWHQVEKAAFAFGAKPRVEKLFINEAAWKNNHDP